MYRRSLARLRAAWTATPSLQYAAVMVVPMVYFLAIRLRALSALLDMNATPSERTLGHTLAGVLLGILEDAAVTALLVALLVLLELIREGLGKLLVWATARGAPTQCWCIVTRSARMLGLLVRVLVVLLLTLLTLSLCTLDLLVVRAREIHFTTDIVATYWRERDQGAGTLELEPYEITMILYAMVALLLTALVFTVGYIACVDLLRPSRASKSHDIESTRKRIASVSTNNDLEAATHANDCEHSTRDTAAYEPLAEVPAKAAETESSRWTRLGRLPSGARLAVVATAVLVVYAVLIAVTSAIAHAAHPTITAIALNASLNELFRSVVGVTFTRSIASSTIDSAAYYLETSTETYELFQSDVLYRKTTGFQGPLAFNITVDDTNPPNVLVLAVESFRYLDSLYLAANTSAGAVLHKHNLTVTPHFDRWAKRGIAFSNMWSSWQTSRSIEAILFSQVVYDSLPVSGTSRGRVDTTLVGMPQFYQQKGYETIFTTGGNTSYDQWDKFLPAHGFETVLGAVDMKRIAERDYNISKHDWWGDARRGFIWGVHDDVSLPIIGDLMIQKSKEQTERVQRGEPKKPFFLNHYTISSHFPFKATPAWLDSEDLPDFTPLCEGWQDECTLIQKYAKLRYFTDMELGKFLDRMETAGVLNDTIVVIVGDHGQSPEMGLANPVFYETAVQHVAGALIAQGRLGESAGLVISDATQQNDIQNTLADIVGVPRDGFLQSGVGRSLKRQIPFGERLVYSNNPWRRLSIVRGHERFVYDRNSNRMALYDTLTDPLETTDLLPTRSQEEMAAWRARWRAGREIDMYYKTRWDRKCLAQVEC